MENLSYSESRRGESAVSDSFLYNVFLWMFAGLLMTAAISYLFASNDSLLGMLMTQTGLTGLGYVVMFAPIGFVLIMSFGFNRLSFPALVGLFLAYSAVMGMSLSFIFLIYTQGSIFSTFLIAATMFGVMAIYGYTTKSDLTKIGNILLMGLIGVIIGSVINMFLRSSAMGFIITILVVVIFTGLTAYDVQKLKRIGMGVEYGTAVGGKLAIMGALSLYLDFINLFLALLRLFGNRRD